MLITPKAMPQQCHHRDYCRLVTVQWYHALSNVNLTCHGHRSEFCPAGVAWNKATVGIRDGCLPSPCAGSMLSYSAPTMNNMHSMNESLDKYRAK